MKNSWQNPNDAFIQQLKANERQRLAEKFRLKTFAERNQSKYWACRILSYITNLLNIATGFTFLLLFGKNHIPPILPEYLIYFIAGAIALLILTSIEYFKRESIYDYYVEGYLKAKKYLYLSLFFNLGLMTTSIFFSVKGADWFVRLNDNKVNQITQNIDNQSDSTKKDYQALLKPYQAKILHYQSLAQQRAQAHVWGRLTPEENQDLQFAQSQIQKYEFARQQKLQKLETILQEQTQSANQATNQNAHYMIWFALINELVNLLLIFFGHYYEYRKWFEQQLEFESNDNDNTFGLNTLRNSTKSNLNPFKPEILNENEFEPIDSKVSVGFKPKFNQTIVDEINHLNFDDLKPLSEAELNELKSFLQKYAYVVKGIQAGMTNSQIMQAYSVSRSTIYNVKRCLKTVQAYLKSELISI